MFPRIKSYKNKDGSFRHYLYLVAAKRIGGKVRQVTTANFGRVENADKILPDVVEKLSKFTSKLRVINLAKDMKADWVKEYGAVIVFKKLWEMLGLGRYLRKYMDGRKIKFDVEEIIYSMVLNRLIEPKSELGIHTWIKNVYGMKEVKDLHQWYRSLDFLIEHKDELESDLYEAQKDLFNQEIDMVLMDTTSVVYWGDGEKAEEILDYGFSKQKRFDLKQVIVGIFFVGPKPFVDLIKEAAEEVVRDAVRFGCEVAKKQAKETSKKRAEKYLGYVTEIAKAIHTNVDKFVPNVDVKEIRTNFDLLTQQIELLVLTDYSDPEDWIKFSKLVSALERIILQKWNLMAKIFYLKADSRVDYEMLDSDYPFVYCPNN